MCTRNNSDKAYGKITELQNTLAEERLKILGILPPPKTTAMQPCSKLLTPVSCDSGESIEQAAHRLVTTRKAKISTTLLVPDKFWGMRNEKLFCLIAKPDGRGA